MESNENLPSISGRSVGIHDDKSTDGSHVGCTNRSCGTRMWDSNVDTEIINNNRIAHEDM